MWAKGPTPGYSPKTEALRFIPNAVCKKKHSICNIVGYIVYPSKFDSDSDTNPIASGVNSKNAWEKALLRVAKFNHRTNEYEALDSV